MPRTRPKRWGTASILVVAIATAGLAPAAAQDDSPSRFLPGAWSGTVVTAGAFTVSGVRDDGTDFAGSDTISASNSTFEITVDENGSVAGQFELSVEWVGSGTGETPVTGDSYDINSTQSATGSLTIGGDASQLSASGPGVRNQTVVNTAGTVVESVSGPRDVTIGLTYVVETADCASASGTLTAAEGSTIMRTVPGSSAVQGSRTFTNELTSTFWAVPTFDGSDDVLAAYIALAEAVRDLLAQPADAPIEPEALLDLILQLEQIRSDLARLDICQDPLPDDWDSSSLRSFLDEAITILVARVFGNADAYTVQDLVSVLYLAVRGGAIGAELVEQIREGLGAALDDAIATDAVADVQAIAVAAAQHGFIDLYETAINYLEGVS